MRTLEVTIEKNDTYINIFTYEYNDGELDHSDFSQVDIARGITGATQLIKEIYKGQRFNGGRHITIN